MRISRGLATLKRRMARVPVRILRTARQPRRPIDEQGSAAPEWEYVPEGWARKDAGQIRGWDVASVLDAYRAKLSSFRAVLEGPGPIAVPTSAAFPIGSPSIEHQNHILAFAYALVLASRTSDSVSILDWGGGLGYFYFLSRALLPPDIDVEYHCKELPTLCDYGRRALTEICFHDDDSCLGRKYDLVVASSSLQYHEHWAEVLGGLAVAARRYLFLTRVPVVFSHPSFVALQRTDRYAFETEYLSWVFSRDELLERTSQCGFELVREFLFGDKPQIAGAPEQDETRGFLFQPALWTTHHDVRP